ncbi:MAG: hypothetical protein ACI4C3_02935 [Bacteroides sp.]
MSVSNGIISAPVSIEDVASCLGVGSYDLGTLCTSSRINKWARWKPVPYSKVAEMTEKELMSVNYGLVPQKNTKLLEVLTGAKTFNSTGYTFNDLLSANTEWTYNKPSSYYRLTDFLSPIQSGGYNHGTSAPLDGFSGTTIDMQSAVAPSGLVSKTGTADTSAYGTIIEGSSLLYTSFKMRFSDSDGNSASWQAIGGADPWMIPINALLGSLSTGNYRLALAVAYSTSTSGSPNAIDLFAGSATLKELLNNSSLQDAAVRWIAPNMYTNTMMYNYIKSYVEAQSSGQYGFMAIPCLVEDSQVSVNSTTSTNVSRTSLKAVYSVPKGAVSITMIFNSNGIQKESDKFKVVATFSGRYVNLGSDSTTIYPVYDIGIEYYGESDLQFDYSISATWTYSYQTSPSTRATASGYVNNLKFFTAGMKTGTFYPVNTNIVAATVESVTNLSVSRA